MRSRLAGAGRPLCRGCALTRTLQRLLPVLVALAAIVVACRKVIDWALHGGRFPGPNTYNYAILAPDYFNAGFVRRGLGGTILALIDRHHTEASLAGFHVFCAVFLAVPVGVLLSRLAARGGWHWLWFAMVLLLSPQMLLAWSVDVGKGDMMTMGFVVWAMLAALDRRYLVAVLVLVVGSLAHETTVFFGAPLVAATWFLDLRARRATIRQGVAALVLMGGLLALVMVLQRVLGPTPEQVSRLIMAGGPATTGRILAAYMTAGGLKMLATSSCMSFARPAVVLDLAACLVIVLLYDLVLLGRSRQSRFVLAFVALLPLVVLSIVAIDYGRWLSLAVTTAWFAAVALRLREREPVAAPARAYVAGGIVFAALVAMGSTSIFFANVAVDRLAVRIWRDADRDVSTYLEQCDPDWRTMVFPLQAAR